MEEANRSFTGHGRGATEVFNTNAGESNKRLRRELDAKRLRNMYLEDVYGALSNVAKEQTATWDDLKQTHVHIEAGLARLNELLSRLQRVVETGVENAHIIAERLIRKYDEDVTLATSKLARLDLSLQEARLLWAKKQERIRSEDVLFLSRWGKEIQEQAEARGAEHAKMERVASIFSADALVAGMMIKDKNQAEALLQLGRLTGLTSADRGEYSEAFGYARCMRVVAMCDNGTLHEEDVATLKMWGNKYAELLTPFFEHMHRLNGLDHRLADIRMNKAHPLTYTHPVFYPDELEDAKDTASHFYRAVEDTYITNMLAGKIPSALDFETKPELQPTEDSIQHQLRSIYGSERPSRGTRVSGGVDFLIADAADPDSVQEVDVVHAPGNLPMYPVVTNGWWQPDTGPLSTVPRRLANEYRDKKPLGGPLEVYFPWIKTMRWKHHSAPGKPVSASTLSARRYDCVRTDLTPPSRRQLDDSDIARLLGDEDRCFEYL